jgi:hypothetical protein
MLLDTCCKEKIDLYLTAMGQAMQYLENFSANMLFMSEQPKKHLDCPISIKI